MSIETKEPPCRVCGSSRDAHGTEWNHDHRYRAERYCEHYRSGREWNMPCGKVAVAYVHVRDVDTTAVYIPSLVCSAHLGVLTRKYGWDVETDRIDRSR